MSFDDTSRPHDDEFDPLTAPVWVPEDEVDAVLAPELPAFMPIDEDTMIRRRAPQPPDVDEIINGEYTGWVPLIKSGESLDDAKRREEERLAAFDLENDWEQIEVSIAVETQVAEFVIPDDIASDPVTEVRNPIVEVRGFMFPNDIVADPDYVVSPAEALEEARRRIAQMRASLQTNLNRVSESFEHPIFTPEVSVQHAPPFIPNVDPVSPEPVAMESQPVEVQPAPTVDAFDEIFETKPEPQQARVVTETRTGEEFREEPRMYTQSTQQTSPTIIIDEAAEQTHSLELVIMRDEIKDLRDRLDSSQKLIEQLMVRLADLAELALKRDR